MKQKKRSEIKKEDTWDLEVIYPTLDSFYKDLNDLEVQMPEVLKYKGKLLESSFTILEFLKLSETLERKLYKLYYYAHLNFDVDTTNTKSSELYGQVTNLMTKYTTLTSFVNPELLKGNYNLILKYITKNQELAKYKFNFQDLYRYKKHTLSTKEEEVLSNLSEALSYSNKIYESLTDTDLLFPSIIIDGVKTEFTESNYSLFIENNNRLVRKKAFNILYKTYQKYLHTLTDTFRFNIETNSKIAKMKHYNSSLEASLFSDNIPVSVYNNLIETVNKNLDVLYDYYDLKREVLQLDKLHLYDIYAEMIPEVSRKYTFLEAKEIVLNGLKVLGNDYQDKLNQAFSNRFIDIYNNKGKRSGAYSSGFYDTNPYILLNFEGNYSAVTTLAHELGHSIHTMYSCSNNPYNTSNYKIFVAEVASTVNELLLLRYLLKETNQKEEKLFLLNKLLELFKGTIFRQTMFAEFERNMYKDHENGIILTGEYISQEYYKLVKKYFGSKVICDKLIQYEWLRIPHFYYNFYVYKYATSLSVACKIVSDIETKGEVAVNKYLEFLKTGGSMYPKDELLVCDVDINNSKYIEDAISMFKETILEFRNIYRK